jgi:hypothetical protein
MPENPKERCPRCGRDIEGQFQGSGSFAGLPAGQGILPQGKDPAGWRFQCDGPHNGSSEPVTWFRAQAGS